MKTLNTLISITRLRFLKSELDRMLVYSMLFSIALVVARVAYSRELIFVFMPWNLFLAYLPYQLLRLGMPMFERSGSRLQFTGLFCAWLLFIPNAFYMVTDLFHLYQREHIPLWFDLVLLMSFAWNGLILGFLSIRQMEKMFAGMFPRIPEGVFVAVIMFLNGFGVYLGRYLRFNSWDVVSSPFKLILEVGALIANPVDNLGAWAMIISFTLMMILIYEMLKKISRQLQ
jgi:uncharacterized membrane protein